MEEAGPAHPTPRAVEQLGPVGQVLLGVHHHGRRVRRRPATASGVKRRALRNQTTGNTCEWELARISMVATWRAARSRLFAAVPFALAVSTCVECAALIHRPARSTLSTHATAATTMRSAWAGRSCARLLPSRPLMRLLYCVIHKLHARFPLSTVPNERLYSSNNPSCIYPRLIVTFYGEYPEVPAA